MDSTEQSLPAPTRAWVNRSGRECIRGSCAVVPQTAARTDIALVPLDQCRVVAVPDDDPSRPADMCGVRQPRTHFGWPPKWSQVQFASPAGDAARMHMRSSNRWDPICTPCDGECAQTELSRLTISTNGLRTGPVRRKADADPRRRHRHRGLAQRRGILDCTAAGTRRTPRVCVWRGDPPTLGPRRRRYSARPATRPSRLEIPSAAEPPTHCSLPWTLPAAGSATDGATRPRKAGALQRPSPNQRHRRGSRGPQSGAVGPRPRGPAGQFKQVRSNHPCEHGNTRELAGAGAGAGLGSARFETVPRGRLRQGLPAIDNRHPECRAAVGCMSSPPPSTGSPPRSAVARCRRWSPTPFPHSGGSAATGIVGEVGEALPVSQSGDEVPRPTPTPTPTPRPGSRGPCIEFRYATWYVPNLRRVRLDVPVTGPADDHLPAPTPGGDRLPETSAAGGHAFQLQPVGEEDHAMSDREITRQPGEANGGAAARHPRVVPQRRRRRRRPPDVRGTPAPGFDTGPHRHSRIEEYFNVVDGEMSPGALGGRTERVMASLCYRPARRPRRSRARSAVRAAPGRVPRPRSLGRATRC